jgi:hypothetical protein
MVKPVLLLEKCKGPDKGRVGPGRTALKSLACNRYPSSGPTVLTFVKSAILSCLAQSLGPATSAEAFRHPAADPPASYCFGSEVRQDFKEESQGPGSSGSQVVSRDKTSIEVTGDASGSSGSQGLNSEALNRAEEVGLNSEALNRAEEVGQGSATTKVIRIGIAGAAGSGKSTLAATLAKALESRFQPIAVKAFVQGIEELAPEIANRNLADAAPQVFSWTKDGDERVTEHAAWGELAKRLEAEGSGLGIPGVKAIKQAAATEQCDRTIVLARERLALADRVLLQAEGNVPSSSSGALSQHVLDMCARARARSLVTGTSASSDDTPRGS